MKNIAVFASGTGTNFQAIVESKELQANIALLVCDKKDALVIQKAQEKNIPTFVFHAKDYPNKAAYERDILMQLNKYDIDWLVLAGYMRLVGPTLINAYPNKIVNIHPSLLPNFPGLHAIEQAYNSKVRLTGVTIHFVDEGMDTGKIIAQKALSISSRDSLESLEEKIHKIEHELYPVTLQKLIGE
ncbi:MAG: phosphoribosylglycinamide formyltransferase [Streptococcaceae bacterium]|jgi:phosphoribosylglycinamide formyltransferase-1|nr:phosphoribosylglycinamide formyltransferase [Streptococcaceae bacterium]